MEKMENTKGGVLLFHQGFTDILNCLPLVTFYAKTISETITLVIRPEVRDLILFYTKPYLNIKVIFDDEIQKSYNRTLVYTQTPFPTHFHGFFDSFRKDPFAGVFSNLCFQQMSFLERFYTPYNIPFETRITHFECERNSELEELFYKKNTPSKPYFLIHSDVERGVTIPHTFECQTINIDKSSSLFFDAVKLIEGANEVHLIDSVWAVFIYLLDAKYGYFQHIPIHVYLLREYSSFFTQKRLANWVLHKSS